MIVGIKAVEAYTPSDFIDNIGQSEILESTEGFIVNKIGMLKLPIKSVDEDTSDLAKAAVDKLCSKHDMNIGDVECLVLITQNPDVKGLPHTSAILHRKLNLHESCVVFDVSLGCSGYVQGLSIIKSFMEGNGFCNGILVTADPYSKIIDRKDRDTAMLFGDGASATWLSGNASLWDIGPFDFGIDSSQNDALCVDKEGLLSMNGRAVFTFAATRVPVSVSNVLNKAKLIIDDIDLVLLHQGSKYIVETLAKRLCSEGKTPFKAEISGNTVSSSIPMMLVNYLNDSNRSILLSGFGVGLSWATCLLQKRG